MAVMTSNGGNAFWRQNRDAERNVNRSVNLTIVEGGAAAKPTRRLSRVAARRRAEAWAILVAAVVVFAALTALIVRGVQAWVGGAVSSRPMTTAVTVQPGDTVWSLAKQYGDPNAYILDRVDAVTQANKATNVQRLVPGQRIYVPVTNPAEVARLQRNVAMSHP